MGFFNFSNEKATRSGRVETKAPSDKGARAAKNGGGGRTPANSTSSAGKGAEAGQRAADEPLVRVELTAAGKKALNNRLTYLGLDYDELNSSSRDLLQLDLQRAAETFLSDSIWNATIDGLSLSGYNLGEGYKRTPKRGAGRK